MTLKNGKKSIASLLVNGALSGLGFGLAVSIVHLAMGIILIITLGMPPLTWFAGKTIFIEVPLAIAAGLLLCPSHLSTKGRFIHPAAMAVVWIALEWLVAVDPAKPMMWAAPSIGALLLYYLFQWVWSKRKWVVAAVTLGAPIIILALPVIYYNASKGYESVAFKGAAKAAEGAPDVVFIVMDTVRAKNVSAYGYERKTTPNFDVFAKQGVLFEKAITPATWSLPAHASLFAGALPSIHNAHAETRFLDDKMPTLAESLAKAGFETRCFTANPHISPGFGLNRGFGWSDNAWLTGAGARGFTFIYRLVDALGVTAQDKGGALVVSNVENWMKQRSKDSKPAFVFVNFLEAHFPFHQLPDEFRYTYTKKPLSELRKYGQLAFGAQMGRQLTKQERDMIQAPIRDLYDGGILYTDYLMSRVVDLWRQRGTLDKTIFVILGDHGEHVGEHGAFGHFASLYEEALWVPFMVYYPPKIPANRRIKQEVSTACVFATIFDLLGLELPGSVQYKSLLPALEPQVEDRPRPAFGRPVMSERFEERLLSSRFKPGTANGQGPLLSPWGRYRIYRIGDYKLAKHFVNGKVTTYLYDLKNDSGEMNDISKLDPSKLAELEQELKNWETVQGLPSLSGVLEPVNPRKNSDLGQEALEQLKALGYIQK